MSFEISAGELRGVIWGILPSKQDMRSSKICNNTNSHEVWNKKKLPKSAKMPLIPFFFYSPCIYIYITCWKISLPDPERIQV